MIHRGFFGESVLSISPKFWSTITDRKKSHKFRLRREYRQCKKFSKCAL